MSNPFIYKFAVEYGVHGATRINSKLFESKELALAFAERWSRSNSTGNYWAEVTEVDGSRLVTRFNLA